MPDSPGNYLVVMRGSREELVLPCSYTGKVVSAAGTYTHATLTWSCGDGDLTSRYTAEHWQKLAIKLLEVEIQPFL